MTRRLLTAMFAVAVGLAASQAHAWPKYKNGKRYSGGAGTSRSCLTSSARSLLNRIEARFGSMQVVSTCRPGARIAGTGRISRHASGNAVDFNAGGRKGAVVRWLIANHRSGGTMTYRGMNHIHVDIGPHFVSLNSGGRGGYRSRKRRSYASARKSRHASRSSLGARSRQTGVYREAASRFVPSAARLMPNSP